MVVNGNGEKREKLAAEFEKFFKEDQETLTGITRHDMPAITDADVAILKQRYSETWMDRLRKWIRNGNGNGK